MKTLLIAFFALLIAGFWTETSMGAQRIYYGYPSLQEAQDGQEWILYQDGLASARLGTLSSNKKAQDCLREAFGLNEMIMFTGNWQQKEYGLELDPASARCAKITKKPECPRKVLRTVTIDATNMGVVCGDFCYLGLLPEYGDELSMFADEEEMEKLFGPKPGKKVRVTYTVEMDWMPENLENPDNGQGSCVISAVFKSGKLLGK